MPRKKEKKRRNFEEINEKEREKKKAACKGLTVHAQDKMCSFIL